MYLLCICRFERDVWAPGNRTVCSGESLQLPHSGGKAGESVHYPERGPGQRGSLAFFCLCTRRHRHVPVPLVTPTAHTHTRDIHEKYKGPLLCLTCPSGCRFKSISLQEHFFIIDETQFSQRPKCRVCFKGYRVQSDDTDIKGVANTAHLYHMHIKSTISLF